MLNDRCIQFQGISITTAIMYSNQYVKPFGVAATPIAAAYSMAVFTWYSTQKEINLLMQITFTVVALVIYALLLFFFFPIPCANDFSDHHHFEHTTFSFLHSIVISIWNNCHLVAIQSIKSECMITLYASLYAFLFISFACHRPQSIDFDRNITIRVWCRPKRMLLLCQSVQVRLQC